MRKSHTGLAAAKWTIVQLSSGDELNKKYNHNSGGVAYRRCCTALHSEFQGASSSFSGLHVVVAQAFSLLCLPHVEGYSFFQVHVHRTETILLISC